VMSRAWAAGAHRVVQWNAFAGVMVFAVRKTLWQAWPETTRAMVRAAALKAIDAAQPLQRERAAHEELARNGITVTRLTPAGFAAFRAVVDPVYATWTPKIGAELVEAVRKAAASAPPAAAKTAPASAMDLPK
jgi:TRAP-type transport system periplasmic protein